MPLAQCWKELKSSPANWITASRFFGTFVLVPWLLHLGSHPPPDHTYWLTILFLYLVISDKLDGLVARRFNCVTRFGEGFDPFTDKVFELGTFFTLVWFWPGLETENTILAITLICLEITLAIVGLGALFGLLTGVEVSANFFGKIKFFVVMLFLTQLFGIHTKSPLLTSAWTFLGTDPLGMIRLTLLVAIPLAALSIAGHLLKFNSIFSLKK